MSIHNSKSNDTLKRCILCFCIKFPTNNLKIIINQIFDYDGVNQECKAGNLGDYDHELLGSSIAKRVWIDKSKFCTGEPDPVPNGKWVSILIVSISINLF